jgi:hypothetical protein
MPDRMNTPLNVAAEADDVFIDGPAGIVVHLSADAARETADKLSNGAAKALRHREAAANKGPD